MKPKPINKADFDTSVRPQDDFYRYVNGSWLTKTKIPKTENRWGSFHIVHDRNMKNLRTLLNDLKKRKNLKKNSDEAKLRDLYLTAMNINKRNRQGLTYLKEIFAQIESLESKEGLTELFAFLHRLEVSAPWSLWTDQDDKESKRMVLRIGQGGLGVPDRNYHVKNDKESKRIATTYKAYIKKLLAYEKYFDTAIQKTAVQKIIAIEKRLAKASMTPVERRDPHATYNKRTLRQLEREYKNINWKQYANLIGLPNKARDHIIVDQPRFLAEVNKMIGSVPLSDWKLYLHWHFLDTYVRTLGEEFIAISFSYHGKVIQGLKKDPELWKRAVGITNTFMRDALGKLYVKRYFSRKAKQAVTKLVNNIIEAYRVRIEELDWMSKATKKKALHKLNAITLQLGYPNKWESYRKLTVGRESHTQNVLTATVFHFEIEMKKLGKPTDPTEWYMAASTVNAYYSPNLNQIAFPAGILQPPFFYPNADDPINYGAIGVFIGHELTHGFDDQGSLFDEKGNLRNWWTDKDRKKFKLKTDILRKQFNKYKIIDGISVNGDLTLGENIADLGGLVLAHKALMLAQKNKKAQLRDGFTPEQRFFVSLAIAERSLYQNEFLKFMTLNDPHSPCEFRVNGPVSNSDAFYKAFNVKPGDKLYRPTQSRAYIW